MCIKHNSVFINGYLGTFQLRVTFMNHIKVTYSGVDLIVLMAVLTKWNLLRQNIWQSTFLDSLCTNSFLYCLHNGSLLSSYHNAHYHTDDVFLSKLFFCCSANFYLIASYTCCLIYFGNMWFYYGVTLSNLLHFC